MYFFVNPTALRPQTPTQAYGPVVSEATTSYRVTSKFCVTGDTPAIAAFAGVVLVQPHAQYPAELCNLAIRVSDISDSRAQFDRVAYVIYRGLRRSSFYTAATPPAVATLTPTTNSDLLQTIWAAYTLEKAKNPLSADPTTDWLGFQYDTYDANLPLDEGFSNPARNTHLTHIKAGQSLGQFADKVGGINVEAGIEFVLVDRFYQPTFADLRAAEMVFKVTASTGPAGHEANYAVQRYRENILNYIDPAAYYTMHYRGGVSFYPSTGPVQTLLDAGDITQTLLGAFGSSQNRIYIDIRNELGGSLNFYRDNEGTGADQGTHFKVGFTETNLNSTNYYTDNWPIFSVVANSPTANTGNLYLSFLQAYNPQPLLFADYCYGYNTLAGTVPLTTENRFSDLTDAGQPWSTTLRLKLVPPALTSGHPVWFVKLMCIRRQMPDNVPANSSIPLRNHPLDHVFFPLSAGLINPAAPTGTTTLLPGKRYVAGTGTGIGTMVEASVMLTKNLAVFRAQPLLMAEPPVLVVPHTYSDADEQPWRLAGITTRKSEYQDSSGKTVSFVKQTVADTGVRAPNQDVLALTVLRRQLVTELIPAINSFAASVDEVRLVAANALRTQVTLRTFYLDVGQALPIPYEIPDKAYWMLDLKVAGLLPSEAYAVSNPYTSVVHAYTLDNVNYYTDEALNGLNLDIVSNPKGYFSTDKLIEYVKIVEKVYCDEPRLGAYADATALHTSTRIRVHSYGPFADAENVTPTHILPLPLSKGPFGALLEKAKQSAVADVVKGAGFIASLPKARYAALRKDFIYIPTPPPAIPPISEGRLAASSAIRLLPEDMAQVEGGLEAYQGLVSSADENGIGDNPSPYVRVIDTAASTVPHFNIDLGHLLYGFEALQLGENATAPGYKEPPIGIVDAIDLAGIMADVATPAAEYFFNLQYPEQNKFPGPDYPVPGEANAFRKYYTHSAPEADLYGDADSIGLDNAYRSLAVQPGSATSVRLSDVLTTYYSPTPGTTRPGLICQRNPLGYHYSRRWFNLARKFNFILPFSNPNAVFAYQDDHVLQEQHFVWVNDTLSPALATLFEPAFQQARSRFRAKANTFAHFWYLFQLNDPFKFLTKIVTTLDLGLVKKDIFAETAKSTPINTLLDTVINDFFLADLKAAILAENPQLVFRTQ